MSRLLFGTLLLVAPALGFGQGGDLTGKRFSHLNMINKETVKNLSLQWVSTNITTGCGPTGTPPVTDAPGRRGGRFGAMAALAPIVVGGFGTGDANNCGPARLGGAGS